MQVQFGRYLPPGGDDEALFHIVHDDDDSEDLDGHECFAAMEQYRKNFSTFDSNSAFVRHFELYLHFGLYLLRDL